MRPKFLKLDYVEHPVGQPDVATLRIYNNICYKPAGCPTKKRGSHCGTDLPNHVEITHCVGPFSSTYGRIRAFLSIQIRRKLCIGQNSRLSRLFGLFSSETMVNP